MKVKIQLFSLLLSVTHSMYAQDIISFLNGDTIRAKVLEISISEIKYKRYDYQSGPLYVSKKDEVATISYENGTKEEINAPRAIRTNTYASILSKSEIKRRKPYVLTDKGIEKVLNSNELHWYGIDFALLKIWDRKKTEDKHGKKLKYTFCPAWADFFDKHVPHKRKKRNLHVKNLVDNRFPFQYESYYPINENTFTELYPSVLELDEISKRVSEYTLNEKEGIGVVIMLETFNKAEEKCVANVAFFDIANKEILWLTKIAGLPGDKGMTAFWGEGIFEVWAYFISKEYWVKRRQFKRHK